MTLEQRIHASLAALVKAKQPGRQLSPVGATIAMLRACQAARARGERVAYTTDAAWLVNLAINRRAGWPDDPSHARGSCTPVNGQYPKKAEGIWYMEVWRAARAVNTPRLIVRPQSLGSAKKLLVARIPHRLTFQY